MSQEASPGNPGDKVSLNPQPLPPKWMPAWLGRLYLRVRGR